MKSPKRGTSTKARRRVAVLSRTTTSTRFRAVSRRVPVKRRTLKKRPSRLFGGVALPREGAGYEIPRTWADRGLCYGTPELVDLIERVGKRLDEEEIGARLYVGDLSPRGGGASAWHKSHKTGRDVDLLFFALDEDGQPAPPPRAMIRFDADGTAEDGRLTFDAARNWELIKNLVSDRFGRVTMIFVAEPLEALIVDYAQKQGERDTLIERAAAIMRQPTDSAPHDDHFHVRIAPTVRAAARRAK